MIAPFDIFHTEKDGTALWCGTAASMEEARRRIGELSVDTPGEYVILSRRTGNKIVVRSDEIAGSVGPTIHVEIFPMLTARRMVVIIPLADLGPSEPPIADTLMNAETSS